MKTILVTGGAGFMGSAFVRRLYEKRPDVRLVVVDCLTYAGDQANLPGDIRNGQNERFAFWYGNITNGELMDTLVSQADVVVHFAAETHVTRSIYDNTQFFRTDVLGTQMVCNAVTKYRDRIERFLHISSSEVYGTAQAPKMDEQHPLNPMSPYASAKAGADRLVYSYWATYRVPAVIVRPFNNYGPRQHMEKAIPRFITAVLLGEKIRLHGDGSAARDYIYVEDTVDAVEAVLDAPAQKVVGVAFNVGSGQDRTMLSIARDVVERMGADVEATVEFCGDRPGQVMRHTADAGKISKTLGWACRTSWDEGLDATIAWYKDNRDWWSRQMWLREIPIITAAGRRELH